MFTVIIVYIHTVEAEKPPDEYNFESRECLALCRHYTFSVYLHGYLYNATS